MRAAMNYIMTGHFSEALNALSGVPGSERSGRWYYLSAMANAGLGNLILAREQAEQQDQLVERAGVPRGAQVIAHLDVARGVDAPGRAQVAARAPGNSGFRTKKRGLPEGRPRKVLPVGCRSGNRDRGTGAVVAVFQHLRGQAAG